MKRAKIVAHRQGANGHRLVGIVCPVCQRRHWLPDQPTGRCPRRPGRFTIGVAR